MQLVKIIGALVVVLLFSGCGSGEEEPDPEHCGGEDCITFSKQMIVAKCPLDGSDTLALMAKFKYGTLVEGDELTFKYKVQTRRLDGTVVSTTGEQTLTGGKGEKFFVTCETGKEPILGVATQVLRYILPQCASSKIVEADETCADRPAEEKWAAGTIWPEASTVEALQTEEVFTNLTDNCELACQLGVLCKTFTLSEPASPMLAALTSDFGKEKFSKVRELFIDDANFPISAATLSSVTGVEPGVHGREGDIYLDAANKLMGQNGVRTKLRYEFSENGADIPVEIEIGETVLGVREVSGDTVAWKPAAMHQKPEVSFPGNPGLSIAFGGAIERMTWSPTQLTSTNGIQCISIRPEG